MTVVTVRPDSTPTGAANFTIYGGAASINAALSDNNVATYVKKGVAGNGAVVVGFGTTTISSSIRVKQVRIRSQVLCPTDSSRLRVTPIVRVRGVNHIGSAQVFSGAYSLAEYSGAYFSTAPDGQAWDQTRINGLRAQISDAATGADLSNVYELFFDIETTTQPTVSVASPTGTVTNTSLPEVSWTYSDSDGTDQDYYQIRVFSSAQYGATGFDPVSSTAFYDSGAVASSDNTATIAEYMTDGVYRAYVTVAKLVSGVPFYSAYAYSQFTIDTTPPTTPSLTTSYSSTSNRVTLTATGATVSGSFDSQVFQIQKTEDSGSTWSDVTGATALVPNGTAQSVVYDYAATRGVTTGYRVRSIGTLGEDEVSSTWSSTSSVSVTNDATWWIKAVSNPTLNLGGLRVSGGFQTSPKEQIGVFYPIGRGTAVTVTAGLQGKDGGLKVMAVGTTEFDSVWALATHIGSLLLQNPDGTQKYIRVTERSFTRSGKLNNAQNEISLTYVEVAG